MFLCVLSFLKLKFIRVTMAREMGIFTEKVGTSVGGLYRNINLGKYSTPKKKKNTSTNTQNHRNGCIEIQTHSHIRPSKLVGGTAEHGLNYIPKSQFLSLGPQFSLPAGSWHQSSSVH